MIQNVSVIDIFVYPTVKIYYKYKNNMLGFAVNLSLFDANMSLRGNRHILKLKQQ